tara:strand:- start:26 stop:235 length:210 start_codon:yes stop_codon:yes gene_type:complete
MSKDDIKIFTGSGVLDLTKRKTEKPTDKPQYISASGGNESIVHENCGTDDCCGECEPADVSEATREKLN